MGAGCQVVVGTSGIGRFIPTEDYQTAAVSKQQTISQSSRKLTGSGGF
jgi:hypothetical protein